MVAPLAIAGIASLAGSAISALGNSVASSNSINAARQNNAMQLAWEREKFDKEIELANTAHQREMADYKAAGINPLLALGGAGAKVPTANAIQPQMGDYSLKGKAAEALGGGFTNAINMIREQKIAEAGIKKAEAEADLTQAQADAIRKDYEPGGIKEKDIQKRQEEIEYIKAQRNVSVAQAKKIMKEAEDIAAKTAYQEIINEIKKKDLSMYWIDKVVNYVLQGLSIFGIGRIVAGLAGKAGDKAIQTTVKNEVNNAFKPENMKEWQSNNYKINRYSITDDGILDRSTGEMLEINI